MLVEPLMERQQAVCQPKTREENPVCEKHVNKLDTQDKQIMPYIPTLMYSNGVCMLRDDVRMVMIMLLLIMMMTIIIIKLC